MVIYQIYTLPISEVVVKEQLFVWMLTDKLKSRKRYMELRWVKLNGYLFDKVTFYFEPYMITLFWEMGILRPLMSF